MKIKGFDISRHQSALKIEDAIKAGAEFIIIRAGIRATKDTSFDAHLAECKRLNIPYGFYWYFEATDHATFQAELKACVSVLQNEMPQYPVFFDMEEQKQIDMLTTAERTDMAIAFCREMSRAGLPSGIYANPSWMEQYFDKSRLVDDYDIWLAHWTFDPEWTTRYDYGQTMWQWGIETVNGVDVDANLCYVDYPAKTAKWYEDNNVHKGSQPDVAPDDSVPAGSDIEKGDIVTVNAGAKFTTGVTPHPFVYSTEFEVLSVSTNGSQVLIGIDGQPTGWMYASDLQVVDHNTDEVENTLQPGDKVKVAEGAVYVNGVTPYDWVYNTVFDLMSVSLDGTNGLIGKDGQVTGWMKLSDLIEVEAAQTVKPLKFAKNNKVKVKSGAKTYSGGKLADYVYSNTYVVMQAGKQGAADYIVIGDGKNVTAAIRADDLTLVK